MIGTRCPYCGKAYKVREAALGKKARCTNDACLKVFRVESGASPATDLRPHGEAATQTKVSPQAMATATSEQKQQFRFESQAPNRQPFTIHDNGEIDISVESVAEARIAIKELRIVKKAISLKKREITTMQKNIRASYTDSIRHKGSKVRGLGKVGTFIRAIQTASRDNARANLASELAPLETAKQKLERVLHNIDRGIIQLEAYVLKYAS